MRLIWPMLGKLDARNKLHVWSIGYDAKNKCLSMTLGHHGGKMRTLTATIVCKSKKSPYEQALVDGHSRWREKLYDGYQSIYIFLGEEPSWSFELHNQVKETLDEQKTRQLYVTPAGKLFEPMLAYDHDSVNELSFPYYLQPKLDGERMVAKMTAGGLKCLSRHTTEIMFLPHINEAVASLLEQLPEGVILDGELYAHGLSFNKIIERVRRSTNPHPDAKVIEYHIFDIFNPNEPDADYESRISLLNLVEVSSPLCIVPTDVVETYEEVVTHLQQYVDDGYEGVMLRKPDGEYAFGRTKNLLKVKNFLDEEGEIIGAQEGSGTQKGMVMWVVRDPRGNELVVQPRGNFKQRTEHFNNYEQYIGKKLKYTYQELSEYGVPRFAKGICIL